MLMLVGSVAAMTNTFYGDTYVTENLTVTGYADYFNQLTKMNDAGYIYLSGNATAENSKMFTVDSESGYAEIVSLENGIWQPSSLEIGSNTLLVGRNAKLGAVGHHLATESVSGEIHLLAHNQFNGQITTKDTRVLSAFDFTERVIFQPDNSSSWVGQDINFTIYSPAHLLANDGYLQTYTTAATEPVRYRIWEGTNDSGYLIFDQSYPASEFPASTEVQFVARGYIEFEEGYTYFHKITSDADLSLRMNASLTTPWFASDISYLREDDLLQTPPWTNNTSYPIGQYMVYNRTLMVSNDSSVQTGSFLSNLGKWFNIGDRTATNYWSKYLSNLYYNDGNVGIGTSSPSEKLEIIGNISLNANVSSGKTNIYLGELLSDGPIFSFGYNGFGLSPNNRLVIKGEYGSWTDELWTVKQDGTLYMKGNVGIGTTSPNQALEVDGNVNISGYSQDQSNRDLNEPNGFVNQVDSVLSINEGTRTFSISPTSSSFRIYSQNKIYDYSSTQSISWNDTEGNHYFYFDETGAIQYTTTFDLRFVMGPWVFIAYVYWDAENDETIFHDCFEERHGAVMDGATHLLNHLDPTRGMTYIDGLGITDLVVDQDGSLDAHAQFGHLAGTIADEDIILSVSARASTVGLPILYLNGSDNNRQAINSGFSVLTAGSGRLAYNQDIGGVHQLTEVANNKFVLYHIFSSTTNTDSNRMFAVVGQEEYASISAAHDGAASEIFSVTPSLLVFKETKPIATIVFQTSDTYSNSVKARTRKANDADWIDWRLSQAVGGATSATVDHQGLINRDANDSHPIEAISSGVTNYGIAHDNGAGAMAISSTFVTDASGNVGIGVVSPAAKLDILNDDDEALVVQLATPGTESSQEVALDLVSKNDEGFVLGQTNNSIGWRFLSLGDNYSNQLLQNDLGFVQWDGFNWSDRLWIDSVTGNVGIGTTSPSKELEVNGGINISDESIIAGLTIMPHLNGPRIKSDYNIDIYTNDTLMARFYYNGNFGIGDLTPNEILDIRSINSDTFLAIDADHPGLDSGIKFQYGDTDAWSIVSDNDGGDLHIKEDNINSRMVFESGGRVTIPKNLTVDGNVGIGVDPIGSSKVTIFEAKDNTALFVASSSSTAYAVNIGGSDYTTGGGLIVYDGSSDNSSRAAGTFVIDSGSAENAVGISIQSPGNSFTSLTANGKLVIGGDINTTANYYGNGSQLTDIGSAAIVDGSITNPKISSNAVNTTQIINGSITSSKIVDGSIINSKISANAINTTQIINGAIIDADISDTTDITLIEGSLYQGAFVDETGLVFHIPFTEVGNSIQYDRSTKINDGTVTGATIIATNGKYASGASFDGNDYINSTSTGFPASNNVRTFEAVIKPTDITLNLGSILYYGTHSGTNAFSVEQYDQTLRIFTLGDSVASGNIFEENQWYLIQVTYDGTYINAWVNGEKVINNQALTVTTSSSSRAYIGSRHGTDDFFDGNIDYVKFYDRVLSNEELRTHYLRDVKGGVSVIKTNSFKVMNNDNNVILNVINGNLGIGTSSPTAKLTINATSGGLLEVGELSSATGDYAIAMGWDANATGNHAMAIGPASKALGFASIALTGNTTASGSHSISMGEGTISSGHTSVSMGYNTIASGDYSIVMGRDIEASGDYSIAFGLADMSGVNCNQNNSMCIMGGNVGIGTTSPTASLSIGDAATAGSKWIHIVDENDAFIILEADTDNFGEASNPWIKFSQDGGLVKAIIGEVGLPGYSPENINYIDTLENSFLIGTLLSNLASDGALQFGTNDSVKMTIKPNGDIGIGTTTPDSSLAIGDNTTTGGKSIHIEDMNDAFIFLEADTDNARETDNSWVKFSQDGGLVESVIGQVGEFGHNPDGTNYTGSYPNSLLIGTLDSPTGSEGIMQLGTNNSVKITIDVNGHTGIGTISPQTPLHVYSDSNESVLRLQDSDGFCDMNPESGSLVTTCSSDESLKENIIDAPSSLNYFSGINVREYIVKASGNTETGVIAQEINLTHPELVHDYNGILMVEQPNPWKILKALQELKAENDAMKVSLCKLGATEWC